MRGHRQGTKRSDGRWQFKRGGKTYCSRSGESHKDAMDRIEKMLHGESSGCMRLSRAIELYVEYREGEDIAESTLTDDRFAAGLLDRALGRFKTDSIDGPGVDIALREWDSQRRTKLKVRSFGARVYRWLNARKLCRDNPFRDSRPVGYRPVMWEEPTRVEDFERAVGFVEGNLHVLYWLMFCTGVRPGSARHLSWFELDDRGNRTYVRLSRAKTPAGRFPIRVHEPAATMLRRLPKTSEYVFPSTSHRETWSARHLLDVWGDAQRKAGLEPRDVYDIKHLCLTERCKRFGGDSLSACLSAGLASSVSVERYYRQIDRMELDERAAGK